MLGIGLALDVALYHRFLPYQPGWLAVPLGLLELGLTMGAAWLLDLNAPLWPAVSLFAARGWCFSCSRTRACPCFGSAGPRTAASWAVPDAFSPPPRPSSCSRWWARRGRSSRRLSGSRPASTRDRSSSTMRKRSSASREPSSAAAF